MDNLDFLAEGDDAPEQIAAPEIEAEAESADGPARGPDGKFVAKVESEPAPVTPAEPQAVAQPEPPPVAAPAPTPEPAKPPEGFVPVSVVQELRKELQALKVQPPANPPPDPYEDLEGYQAHLQQERQAERLGYSRQLAELKHKDNPGLIDTVHEWALAKAGSDPVFNQRALASPDPYGFAIEEYQREQALGLLSDPKTLAAFQAFVSGQAAPQAPAAVPVAAPPQQPIPPRSLAALPNAGGAKPGEQPVGPGVAFDAVFNGS